MSDLSEVTEFFEILGLPTNKVPTVDGVRRQFRKEALARHPDKLGIDLTKEAREASKKRMQELNEACARVLEFLADLPSYEDTASNQEQEELLKMFRDKSNISYNRSSVTIKLNKELGEEFISSLEKAVGNRQTLARDRVVD